MQTVSNVLQGRHNLMRGDTRERVEATVKKLGYHPNIAARGLRSLRTRTFGFLVLDEAPSFLADPLTDLLIAGVADVARDRGYEILLKAERPLSPERELLRPLHEARVDGAFVLMSGEPEMRHSYIAELQQLNTPFVVFDEVLENGEMVVRSNDRASARELTELMISRGRRDIAFIGARRRLLVEQDVPLILCKHAVALGMEVDAGPALLADHQASDVAGPAAVTALGRDIPAKHCRGRPEAGTKDDVYHLLVR